MYKYTAISERIIIKYEEIISKTVLKSGNIKCIAKLWFRDYDSLQEAILDHNKVLQKQCFE